jgi:uncharacterized membrane protein YeiB
VAPSYAASVVARLKEWPAHTLTVLPAIVIVWLGMWAARRRVLEDLAPNRRLLRRVAAGGLGVAILGGLPLSIASAGMVRADAQTLSLMTYLQQISGMFGGAGYVALAGLAARRLMDARSGPIAGRAAGLLTALGQRSLSGYLFQSLAWLLLFAPFTLALGDRLGSRLLTGLVVALLVWVVSLLGSGLLERRGQRGPAEHLLRRLVYG